MKSEDAKSLRRRENRIYVFDAADRYFSFFLSSVVLRTYSIVELYICPEVESLYLRSSQDVGRCMNALKTCAKCVEGISF